MRLLDCYLRMSRSWSDREGEKERGHSQERAMQMRMIIGVGKEDMEREMSRNGTHILAALFLQKMMRI